MSRTERIPATEVAAGDVIVCPNGNSVTVETITRDGRFIDFAGEQTAYSVFGNESSRGVYGAFADDQVTILARSAR